ncbi:MAG: hypothetical protein R3257_07930, partial [bacterium]|nr:hypothetical protein [bacterium]
GHGQAAAALFNFLSQPEKSKIAVPALQERSARQLEIWKGRGPLGHQWEFLAEALVEEATDWRSILPMVAGSFIYQGVKGATLARWARSGTSAWYARGRAGQWAASLAGFIPEVSAFAGLSRWLHPESLSPFSQEWSSAALTLATLKGFGALGRSLNSSLLPSLALQYFGLLTAHRLEGSLGWRDIPDSPAWFLDSLSTLIALNLGAGMAHRLLGPSWAAFMKRLVPPPRPPDLPKFSIGMESWVLQAPMGPSLGPPVMTMVGKTRSGRYRPKKPKAKTGPAGAETHEAFLRFLRGRQEKKDHSLEGPNEILRKTGSFWKAVHGSIRLSPEGTRCLYGIYLGNWDPSHLTELSRAFVIKRGLKEIRIRYRDGKILRMKRNKLGMEEHSLENYSPRDEVYTGEDYPQGELVKTYLYAPWQVPERFLTPGEVLREARRINYILPREEIIEIDREKDGIRISYKEQTEFFGPEDMGRRATVHGETLCLEFGDKKIFLRNGSGELVIKQGEEQR